MSIVINRPIILTETQTKKFLYLSINKMNDKLSAKVIFGVYDSSERLIKEEVLEYKDEEFNVFWEEFNTGTFLYEELVKNEEDFELPEGLEDEFINGTD